ncbi:MAG: hypothetical protein Q8L55_03675 [Phycisphaerales bacterium]|nr:hypothetical protein [Phycisphaerales bacterium]
MNDIERRALLGAAGIGALAALSKAGPLNPPAGSVASTGRTLDEIYNKITFGDGRIPIPASSTTVTIATPGSYVLTGNITPAAGTNGILVSASNVTVDLNGYTVAGASNTFTGVVLTGGASAVVIRNGTVTGFSAGVAAGPGSIGVVFEDLLVKDVKTLGILASSGTVRGIRVRRCSVVDTGSTTTSTDGNIVISGISLTGAGHTIEDCVVSRFLYNGSGTPTIRAIALNSTPPTGYGNLVLRNTITSDALLTGTGIHFFSSGVYRDNTVVGFTTNASGGTNGGGNV